MKKLKRDLMPNRVKKAIKDLTEISHTFIKKRDSINNYEIKGYCFDCGKLAEGSIANAGHFVPSSVGGSILRYHPHNIHLQHAGCNCGYQQEMVKIRYTQAMNAKYGIERVASLIGLKKRIIKADILFYLKMIDLYKQGDEQKIVDFLENL